MDTRNPNKVAEKAQKAVKTNDVIELINVIKEAEALVHTVERFVNMQVMQVRKQDIFNAVDPRNLGNKGKSQEMQK